MKKTKTLKTIALSVVLTLGVFTSVKIIKNYYKELHVDYLNHTKGRTNDFLNSFIY